ncbi:DUF4174 domain-containing protein [Marivita sp. S0852]|uniref:DUF4174 domain-containing protein n=1 Tax=Marivita sp. S0852 TaxID=3373893 RepID=UPI003982A0FB
MNKNWPATLALAALALSMPAFATDVSSQTAPAEPDVVLSADEVSLDDFLWINRPVVVFADTPADPRFVQQMQLLLREYDELEVRDVVVITDTDPDAQSELRTKLRPRGFMLALIGKDGQVKLRKPLPWSVRELSRTIDKMPTRQQEIRDRRVSNF